MTKEFESTKIVDWIEYDAVPLIVSIVRNIEEVWFTYVYPRTLIVDVINQQMSLNFSRYLWTGTIQESYRAGEIIYITDVDETVQAGDIVIVSRRPNAQGYPYIRTIKGVDDEVAR
jgi:hypothetical protein